MKLKILLLSALCINLALAKVEKKTTKTTPKSIDQKVDSLLSLMTLDEKLAQISQETGPGYITGPGSLSKFEDFTKKLATKELGSVLNVWGAKETRIIQEAALKGSRLKIPILFALDIIHGGPTTLPIPLGDAASFDLVSIEKSTRIAAIEASALGLHWTFAPMMDISRDPRWGRVAEGAGEDPYYGSLVAKARIKGFQGDLTQNNQIMACAKHFVGYGKSEAGREYNTTDISERELRELHLPPFKAAVDAGVATFMSGFNELSGVPASGNKFTLDQILRKEWGYNGFVVSDWASVTELIPHGAAANKKQAAEIAINAGVDMEMVSTSYRENATQLLKEGKIDIRQIDIFVKRILYFKFKIGLFENPYRFSDEKKEKTIIGNPEHRKFAREAGCKSIVMVKNKSNILPLTKNTKAKIAIIGDLAVSPVEYDGTWAFFGTREKCIPVLDGIKAQLPNATISFSRGYNIYTNTDSLILSAVESAKNADIIIAHVGENMNLSGEAHSRSEISLPKPQEQLLKELKKLGKPIIVVLTNGRPLCIPWLEENVDAILVTWFLGAETGNSIADVIVGNYNPSAKLPMSFPVNEGQIPIYYNQKNTGRPASENRYTSKYVDVANAPLYPFGYGLSYSKFEYSDLKLDKDSIQYNDSVKVTVSVKNNSKVAGKEVVQLYLRDVFAYGVGRPIKELKGFKLVEILAGETKQVTFVVSNKDLCYYKLDMSYGSEPGMFDVMVGGNSRDLLKKSFKLIN